MNVQEGNSPWREGYDRVSTQTTVNYLKEWFAERREAGRITSSLIVSQSAAEKLITAWECESKRNKSMESRIQELEAENELLRKLEDSIYHNLAALET